MPRIPPDKLKTLVIETGLVTSADFDAAKEEADRTGRDIGEILVSKGFLSEEYLSQIMAGYFGVSLAGLTRREIPSTLLGILPEDVARSKNAVVFEKTNGTLKVAMLDPGELETITFLERYTGKKIEPYLATDADMRHALAQYRKPIVESFQRLITEQLRAVTRLKGVTDLSRLATEVPIVSIVDSVISYAAALNASDIHIEIISDAILIRFRIDGILREIARLAPEIHAPIIARIKIMSGLQIDEHSKPQDGRIKYKRGEEVFDIRVSVMPTFYGEKVAMRLLLGGIKPLSLAELGMLDDHIKITQKNSKKTFGMILSTGPTSSGKTTTQYSMLAILNRPEVNIVTIEDPIEYELRYVNQTQVNPKAGIDFASGLRAFLRQDPNIIMVGEIRDKETAEIATHAALTGHLVLTTLHTNDAATAVPRLTDMGVQSFLVSSTLNMIMAQRLVRKICPDCIESFEPPEAIKEAILEQLKSIASAKAEKYKMPKLIYRAKGCKACGHSGYQGRLAIFEILDVDEDVREYISRRDFTLSGLRKLAFEKGMRTMFEDGMLKAEKGITTVEEVLRVIRE